MLHSAVNVKAKDFFALNIFCSSVSRPVCDTVSESSPVYPVWISEL